MLNKLYDFFNNKKILLLGFGLEGQSTLRLLEKLSCAKSITIADKNAIYTTYPLICGENYLDSLNGDFDIIMKSPGIALFNQVSDEIKGKITGQTDLFLRFCRGCDSGAGVCKVVGITGTKGKSTTSSLLHHILTECGIKSKLIGNIGVPPLEIAEDLSYEVAVVELSCHQLEYVKASPQIAILLNIYEEHLDHYTDFAHYKYAKENIFRYQRQTDILIRGEDVVSSNIDSDKAKLRGKHNLHNIAVAVNAAVLLGVTESEAIQAAYSFNGLEHRLELFAETNGVSWVNDSISTIPAAVIAAVEAFPETDTLIIGGMDRGIDYSTLVAFLREWLKSDTCRNVIALPDSGHKIAAEITLGSMAKSPEHIPNVHKVYDLSEAVDCAKEVTKRCCILSPAAASYGFYKNFEERGRHFKKLVN